MSDTLTLGKLIRQSRIEKGYSQRELAKLLGINFTYLSKLENDNADYPPSREVIKSLATNLELNEAGLARLAGRIDLEDEAVFRELMMRYEQMPALLRLLRLDSEFAKKVFLEMNAHKYL